MSAVTDFGTPVDSSTRMLFFGDAALTDSFQLIGFETWADPATEELNSVLEELLESKRNAFIILDSRLSAIGSLTLDRVRKEGGHILISEVPALNDPDGFRCSIDSQINTLMGKGLGNNELSHNAQDISSD